MKEEEVVVQGGGHRLIVDLASSLIRYSNRWVRLVPMEAKQTQQQREISAPGAGVDLQSRLEEDVQTSCLSLAEHFGFLDEPRGRVQ